MCDKLRLQNLADNNNNKEFEIEKKKITNLQKNFLLIPKYNELKFK